MPFSHRTLKAPKPKNLNYLWKKDGCPDLPSHIGEHIKKRRYELKMPAYECQRILRVDKSTLTDWERGRHKPWRENLARITRFLGYTP